MRVLTWNLWGRRGDWRARREAILATLEREAPDVCGLQEVDGHDEPLAGWLAERLGLHAACHATNAVLSRRPILAEAAERLPAGDEPDERRTVLHALVDAPGGTLPFFTAHLNSAPHHSAVRRLQVAAVARFVAAHPGDRPPVVTGDLNAEPDSDEVRLLGGHLTAPVVPGLVLVDAWRYTDGGDPGWTWNRRNPHAARHGEPNARIDYVLLGPGGGRQVTGARLAGDAPVDGTWPSDHAAVVVDLDA